MKKIAILFIGALFLFTSCEETQSPIYDGSQTLAYFNGTTSSLEVEINNTNSIDISVGASTISSSDRTVAVSVDVDNTTAAADIYSFPSSVTIPAGEFFGTLTVTAVDNGLTTQPETLSLQIDSIDGGVGSSVLHTVSIVEICPIATTFATGDYALNFVSGGVGAAGFAAATKPPSIITSTLNPSAGAEPASTASVTAIGSSLHIGPASAMFIEGTGSTFTVYIIVSAQTGSTKGSF